MSIRIKGARWSAAAAGIKNQSKGQKPPLDLALLELVKGSSVAAVFTQNAFCAAPVVIAKQRVSKLSSQHNKNIYCLINSGNANAGTGKAGLHAVEQSTQAIAQAIDCAAADILPFSTGVIGEPLPVDTFTHSAAKLVSGLADDNWQVAAEAIMTTDTVAKIEAVSVEVEGQAVEIAGIAKGAGMIKPNMATMLAYIVCDAKIPQEALQACLSASVNQSFNRITVDGDTSTNDACVLAATAGGGAVLDQKHKAWPDLVAAISGVLRKLAIAIIRDAEGASKFVQIDVRGGIDASECLQVAYTVAESPLVKTAFFASDANWGRVLAAVGRAGLKDLDVDKVEIILGDYLICKNGGRVFDYDESIASGIMQQEEIHLTINLNRGNADETVWTSDLSHDYVRINAEYRT